ncbi:rhodanese-like domain-containing protein [Oceanithermus profundus]|uniref:rhodanese-like domain-containing protein n=1 Tax=Oceanithermus profundus TaxID=187137 RepID=UPI0002D2A851|nr:rhodanese-like domain-containing protein [Oceanithermus profundus]
METIGVERYHELLEGGALAVDVRAEPLFKARPTPGAVNVPWARIQEGDHDLPKDRPLVLLCEVGQMSRVAALYLEADGYGPVYVLEGGLRALDGGGA